MKLPIWAQALLVASALCANALPQDVPSLIRTYKPAVVAILAFSAQKLPDEAQLPNIGTHKTPEGVVDAYVYVAGTGFFVSKDGYVVTAQHVVGNLPQPITILLSDEKTSLIGKVVTSSVEHDFAILKFETTNSPFITFEPFRSLAEGDDVMYMGHPFGIPSVVTNKAMISWMGTSEGGDAYQLNGIVNSGNSGGPLMDIKSGHVVGIVKAKYGTLTPYLQMIANGKLAMGINLGGGNFDLKHFVTDVASMMEIHIQMGIGYAVSTEYAETQLNSLKQAATSLSIH
jgi:S1-C subfamily serine protease